MFKYVYIILLYSTFVWAEPFEDEFSTTADLESTVMQLTDKIEKLEHQNLLLQKRLDALASDIEFRFKELQSSKANTPEKKNSTTKATPAKPADPKLAKENFDKAYALIKAGKYDKAEDEFSKFVTDYPNSTYTGAAYYWMGESFSLRKKYDKAALNYLQSFSKFPKNEKADLSMLKLASSLKMLGKNKESCAMLAKLKAKESKLSVTMKNLLKKEMQKSSCK